MRTVYGDHARFEQTYFSTYKGKYFTGDGCRRDADGYYWITGRVDDVINVSGHRMGTAEVESSLVAHAKVSEAAVVGYPHDIKGQGIYAYVTLMAGTEPTEELRKELVAWVRKDIGPIASPDLIQFAPGLPKTRSGKIMRRILRKIAEDEPSQPRRHLDAGRSRRGRRSRAEPAEQEGRGGIGRRRSSLASRHAARRHREASRPGSPAASSQNSAQVDHTSIAARASLTRSSDGDLRCGRFRPSVVFRSFTLIRTFPFFPRSKRVSQAGVETIRLTHAVKNTWARQRPGFSQAWQGIEGPGRRRAKVERSMSMRIAVALAATIGAGVADDVGGAGAAGNGRHSRRLLAGHDRGEDQRTPALSHPRFRPRHALSGRRRQGRQAVGRHHQDRRQVSQPGLVAAGRSQARQARACPTSFPAARRAIRWASPR